MSQSLNRLRKLVPALLIATLQGSSLQMGTTSAADKSEHGTPPPITSPAVKNIGVAEFEKLRSSKTNVVLDVRTAREYKAGHIPGAILIDVNSPDFEKKVSALDTNKTYLVHCGAGVRSAKACETMSKLRFESLYNLEGGMKAWEKAGNKPDK